MGLNSLFKRLTAKAGASGSKSLPVQPPLLVAPVRFPYGPFQFKAQLARDISCEVQATTDLRNWISIFAGDSAGEFDYVDSQASKFSHRFYRLNVLPALEVNANDAEADVRSAVRVAIRRIHKRIVALNR